MARRFRAGSGTTSMTPELGAGDEARHREGGGNINGSRRRRAVAPARKKGSQDKCPFFW